MAKKQKSFADKAAGSKEKEAVYVENIRENLSNCRFALWKKSHNKRSGTLDSCLILIPLSYFFPKFIRQ
jgi:hypothetical protein